MSAPGGPGGKQIWSKPVPYVFPPQHNHDTRTIHHSTDFAYYRPERGSFPLDHDNECKHIIADYLKCIRKQRYTPNEECRGLSKQYLQCRMDNNLMTKDEMRNLGFQEADQGKSGEELKEMAERSRDGSQVGK